ncbi:carbohydrate diacid transcriptional activator CdaR [Corynebacterium capitovis DSM 44611]|uniref:PucR family transcriptional regulator n=1 Tax=Corynebacterium capitovis TaxID=131081 RepID=UPI0003797927|nr:PucR family transcriptional regulator [Corynebacterium capitovis]WKD58386.1 carbohydrate diacid transcriptional activator CdaR [Corynebacterium capitovis DSM 44611]
MGLTFEWLRNNRDLALRQVVEPTAAEFDVVQTSELEDASEFIQPNSLVLTVGIAFNGRETSLGPYIDHLADAGAVAIGFGTGLTFPALPHTVIDTATRRGIGLFDVPRHVPFISIVTAAHQEQRRLAHLEQQQLFDAQERLTKTATRGSLDALLTEAAATLHARVTISTAQGTVVGVGDSGETGPTTHRTSYRMTAGSERHHEIEVRSTRELTPASRSLIRHVAGLADMLLARPFELRAARNELNSFALSVRLGLGTETDLLPTAFDSPVDADGLTRPVIVAADNARALTRARASLDDSAEHAGQFLYTAPLDTASFLLLVRGDQPIPDLLASFGPSARQVRIAVGRRIAATDLTLSHLRALRTRAGLLALGEHSLPDATALPWLTEPAVVTALSARHAELFDRLRHLDDRDGTDYARTLTVYLRHGGQLVHTADALGIHRHTARNRIAKIQELCEIDLSDPATFAETFFASLVEE